MIRDKEEDEEHEPLPFEGLEASTVVQDCKRVFNSNYMDANQCKQILIKLLYLFRRGTNTPQTEATELFFGTTKLFESQDHTLRRLVYIILKDLAQIVPDIAIIAVNVLIKDINSHDDMFRANAIRTLRKVADAHHLTQNADRYLKQAVVDKSDLVSSAALVTGIHLATQNSELVKRWGGEVGEALKQRGPMAQYHALALLHKLRKADKLSVSKIVSQVHQIPIRSPYALCTLIRMCHDILKDDYEGSPDLAQFVVNSLKHGSEVVVFEAAKCISSLKNVPAKDINPVVLVLQLYLASHKPVLRFAAVRMLNKIASTNPTHCGTIGIDLEPLASDSNKNIATLAITTLLKTGTEVTVDRLMKSLTTFLNDIGDEFKIIIVDSMKSLCHKFPLKYGTVLHFLSETLRDGGFEFKQVIIDVIISIIEQHPDATDEGLLQLCEVIEDCEYTVLCQRILNFLGRVGPTTSNPNKFIRYINNRISLESPVVRAASVSALAKFGAFCPQLKGQIITLLNRATQDADDEVRDRAVWYSNLLSNGEDLDLFISNTATRKSQATPSVVTALGGGTEKAKDEEQPRRGVSSQFELLTDTATEYVVSYRKVAEPERLIFEFNVENTLEDIVLENVSIGLSPDIEGLEFESAQTIKVIEPNSAAKLQVIFAKDARSYPTGEAGCTLVFSMREEGGDEPQHEEVQVENISVGMKDYMHPLETISFGKDWDEQGELEQHQETIQLAHFKTLQQAVDEVHKFLGMSVLDKSDQVPTKAKTHTALFAGRLCGVQSVKLYVKAKLYYSVDNIVTLELGVRGGDDDTRQLLVQSLCS